MRQVANITAIDILDEWCREARSKAFGIIRDPSQFKPEISHPLNGQDFAVADLLCPRCYGILVRDKMFLSSHEVSQGALTCLLEKRKFDNIGFGGSVLREILGGGVKFAR